MQILNSKHQILNHSKFSIQNSEFVRHSAFRIRNSALFSLGIFGTIKNPLGDTFDKAGQYATVTSGLPLLISNIVRLVTVAAGLWIFFNFITAGFTYITAGGETEKINRAWGMIWQSLIGLIIVVAAFIITGIASQFLFGDVTTILNPVIYGPGEAN